MPITLSKQAHEKGTYILTFNFTDDNGTATNPETLTWTLTDSAGNVINSREDESVSNPTSSEDVVLSGDDLALQTGESGKVARIVTVEATYDSFSGLDLPLRDYAIFYIVDLKAVT